jgi:type IV pilus assembly protein PilN
MARINLLPWREELRKEQQQNFMAVLGAAVVFSGLVMVGVHVFFDTGISNQNSRNTYLKGEIKLLDNKIKEINELESTKRNLQARLDIIQRLQSSRPEIVHLFDELVRTIPDGVFLKKVSQKGGTISLVGIAQSNARISNYMWSLDKSEWLTDPKLSVIQTNEKNGQRNSNFTLDVTQASKIKAEEEAE